MNNIVNFFRKYIGTKKKKCELHSCIYSLICHCFSVQVNPRDLKGGK